MGTNNNNDVEDGGFVIRARVDGELKLRLTNYRTRKDVDRSESSVLRLALEEFLAKRETQPREVAA